MEVYLQPGTKQWAVTMLTAAAPQQQYFFFSSSAAIQNATATPPLDGNAASGR